MKTNEEAAIGYANEQMRCYKCNSKGAPCSHFKCTDWNGYKKGFLRGIEHANRWIDVNEELPDFEDIPEEKRTKYLVKFIIGSINAKEVIRIGVRTKRGWIGEMDWVTVTHWRPI